MINGRGREDPFSGFTAGAIWNRSSCLRISRAKRLRSAGSISSGTACPVVR